jgi:hypothetical protein
MAVHQNLRLKPRCRELLVACVQVGDRRTGSAWWQLWGVGEESAKVGGPVPARRESGVA